MMRYHRPVKTSKTSSNIQVKFKSFQSGSKVLIGPDQQFHAGCAFCRVKNRETSFWKPIILCLGLAGCTGELLAHKIKEIKRLEILYNDEQ